MEKQQYDRIAEQYEDAEKTIEGIHVLRPTFLELCGVHARDWSVLDLACGSGIYSRVLKEAGARQVVGIGIVDNPDAALPTEAKYEVALSLDEGSSGEEGCRRRVTFYKDGIEGLHFYNYLWRRETYEIAIKNAEFSRLQWRNPVISEDGMQVFGRGFWANFLENPSHAVIECRK